VKQLLILSGKGGTGKTTVASAFIKLSNAKAYADCDIDAPNLHLISGDELGKPAKSEFYGLDKAYIDQEKCIECDKCFKYCRFDAILKDDGYSVDAYACEGCGVCEYVCPMGAISMKPYVDGDLMLYSGGGKAFSTAKLKMGSGTSGLLVSEVKKELKVNAPSDADIAIIDGSPGIGCPVIASISGVDMVLIVAEPSISGISDMERIVKTAKRFGVKIAVCINKFDTNLKNTEKIKEFCKENELSLTGEIPFDKEAVKMVNLGKSIVDTETLSGNAVKKVYEKTLNLLNKGE